MNRSIRRFDHSIPFARSNRVEWPFAHEESKAEAGVGRMANGRLSFMTTPA